MRDDQIETVRRLHGELLKQDYISEQEDLALTALLTEYNEMREMLEAANAIGFWFPNSDNPGSRGTSATISVRSTGKVEYHVIGEFPGEADSILEAWKKIKEQAVDDSALDAWAEVKKGK